MSNFIDPSAWNWDLQQKIVPIQFHIPRVPYVPSPNLRDEHAFATAMMMRYFTTDLHQRVVLGIGGEPIKLYGWQSVTPR